MRADALALEVDWAVEFAPALPVAVDFGVECNLAFGSGDPGAGRLRWRNADVAGDDEGSMDGSAIADVPSLSTLLVELPSFARPLALRFDRDVAMRAAQITTLAQPAEGEAQAAFQGVATLFVQSLAAGTQLALLQLVVDAT